MSMRKPCVPLEQRIRLHDEVLRLHDQGLRQSDIIGKIERSSGICLQSSQVSRWVRGLHSPFGRINKFSAEPSPALAYIIGVAFGDGYRHRCGSAYCFGLNATDHEFASETGRVLAKLLGRKEPYQAWWDSRECRWRLGGYSILLYKFLGQPLETLKPYIEHRKECVMAFLRGFFDSEGSIERRNLKVYNTDCERLHYVQYLLKRYFRIEATGPHYGMKAGYRFRDSKTGKVYIARKNCYYLYVRVDGLAKFRRYVGFTIRRKERVLAEATKE